MKDEEEKEEILNVYKKRLEDAMKAGNLAWWEMELPSGKIRFNQRKAEMLGYPPEKFEHYEDFTELLHPDDHDKAMQHMRDHLDGKEERYEVEYRIEKKDGSYKWFRDVGAITEEEDDYKKVTGVVIDIDERKKWERKVKASEERYRTLIETSMVGIVKTDLNDYMEFVNSAFAEMLGYDKEELKRMNISELTTSEEYEKIKEKTKSRDKGYEVYESELICKDGRSIEVLINASPYFVEDGEISGTIGIVQDISEKKKAEERKDLLHSILRHDIRNKTQVIKGYLELLEREEDLSEETQKYVSEALKATEQSTNLIKKIHLLLKAEEEKREPVNVTQKLRDAIDMNKELAKDYGIDIHTEYPSKRHIVEAGPLLKEVFSNVIENSIHHSNGEKIKISRIIKDDEVIYTVEDDGRGISDKEKEKVFKKGFTTQKERGTGLGLFLVKMLIRSYDGEIELKDSELGGAKFVIHLKKAK